MLDDGLKKPNASVKPVKECTKIWQALNGGAVLASIIVDDIKDPMVNECNCDFSPTDTKASCKSLL
jgi:hypothetical protein